MLLAFGCVDGVSSTHLRAAIDIEYADRLCLDIGQRTRAEVSPADSIWFQDHCYCEDIGVVARALLNSVNFHSSPRCTYPNSVRHQQMMQRIRAQRRVDPEDK
jgi:hypothetical protein